MGSIFTLIHKPPQLALTILKRMPYDESERVSFSLLQSSRLPCPQSHLWLFILREFCWWYHSKKLLLACMNFKILFFCHPGFGISDSSLLLPFCIDGNEEVVSTNYRFLVLVLCNKFHWPALGFHLNLSVFCLLSVHQRRVQLVSSTLCKVLRSGRAPIVDHIPSEPEVWGADAFEVS